MEIAVGKFIWDSSTKRKYEIIYIHAHTRVGDSVVIISHGGYQQLKFVRPDTIQTQYTDIGPPCWPPIVDQRVFSIDVVGNVYSFEYYSEVMMSRIYPSREEAEHACLEMEKGNTT